MGDTISSLKLITLNANDTILSKVGLHENGKLVANIMNILRISIKPEENEMSEHMENCAATLANLLSSSETKVIQNVLTHGYLDASQKLLHKCA